MSFAVQLFSKNENCLLWVCDCENCLILETHDHQCRWRQRLACRTGWFELGAEPGLGLQVHAAVPHSAAGTLSYCWWVTMCPVVPGSGCQAELTPFPGCSAHCSTAMRLNGYFPNYSQSHNWPFKLGNRIPDTSYGKNAQCSSPLSLLFKAFRKPLTLTPTLKQAHTSTQS